MKRFNRALAATVAVGALLCATQVAAAAQPASATAAAEASCKITRFGYVGYRICSPETTIIDNPWWHDTAKESFVIGSDHAVWHSWPGSGGWKSMGGGALADGTADLDAWYNGKDHRTVGVYGPDYHWWCSVLKGTKWSGWYREDLHSSCYSM
jgi:hypothetical protein